MNLTKNIIKKEKRYHRKASERYVDVDFFYSKRKFEFSIPIEYRRTGIELTSDEEIDKYLVEVYEECKPKNWKSWRSEQKKFWETKRADVTYSFFESLLDFDWVCATCEMPSNPNFARRIQDLKEMGFTIATDTKKYCSNCEKRKTHHQLIPIKRGGATGYETWSEELRSRIITLLERYDAFEAKTVSKDGLLPDHKFPEIRWDESTRRESIESLTKSEIQRDFQLLNNQRNQQKREACRKCFQTNVRGYPYGIKYYYAGSETWNPKIPKRGKKAENGCVGCGWYDLEKWRTHLNDLIK
ncbi:hypothetical protein [Marinobacter sp. VGCF2001]|uniref:hypothetical protein n=1 Tax=Marinobacter sp. VGCF2001 TaxID=3417189 RepID=UPI003CE962D6